MIDEINASTDALNKTHKAGDPVSSCSQVKSGSMSIDAYSLKLSQIVRVLNGHLTQLQLIDQGTAALQARIDVAQQERRGIRGITGLTGSGSDAVDDFYKSYMGRR